MLYSIITVLIVIICVLLTLVVLLQPGQGQGLSGGLAGGAGAMGGGQGMGARRTADLLSKSTSVLGTALLVLCVLANFAIDKGETNRSTIQESGVDVTAPQDMNAPSNTQPAIPQAGTSENGNGNGSDSDQGNGNGGN
ncbi:MAG: preprotein translocase subunit SecG [Bacteroidota bacterium]